MIAPAGRTRHHTEIELKFQLPIGSRAMLENYPALAETAPQSSHLVSTYFDTPDRALDRCDLTLRVRRDGAIRTQTVKSRADGQSVAARRREWEWPIDQDVPEVEWLARTRPLADAALAIEGRLQPAFTTNVWRTTRLLHLGHDTVVEVAFDEGDIAAGTTPEAISELELELKSGRVEPLYQLAAALQSLAPMWLLSDSKAARGWLLHTGESEGARRAQAPKLKHNVSAAAGFRQLLGGTLGHLTANIGPVLRGDTEGLHQARIAIRETRALLQLFGQYLDRITSRRFNTDLRNIALILGAARDWDVFCLETLPAAMSDLSPDRLEDLNAAAEAERRLAYEAVTLALQSEAFTGMVLGLVVWANGEAFDSSRDRHGSMHQRLSILAPALLDRSARRVRRRGRHVGHLSAEKQHSLRKSLKKLNFDVQYLARFFGGKGVRRYQRCVAALAKLLGAANDAVVTDRLMRKLIDLGRPELSRQALAVERWNTQRGPATSQAIRTAMANFRNASPFWS